MSSTNRAWNGSLELSINGVPLFVAVELYSRVKKTRNESFRNLGPDNKPVVNKTFCATTDTEIEDDEIKKGLSLGKGQFAVLTNDAVEAIKQSGVAKTKVAKPDHFAPLDTIALDLAIDRFAVIPDDGTPGAREALNIVWNGLRASGLAMVSQVSLKGGMENVLVVYADQRGLWAAALPFEDELYEFPNDGFTEDERAATLFGTAVEQTYEIAPFDHERFVSTQRAQRKALIEKAKAGEKIEAPAEKAEPVQESKPDLMALLEAAATTAKPAPKTRKKTAKKEAVSA
jgi:non-homologous end joining protein Ku